MTQVKIYLWDQFLERRFREYEPEDTYTLACEYESDFSTPLDILGDAFERFNVGEDEIAQRYRAEGHRSMSIGDIVVVNVDGEIAFACKSVGWHIVPNFSPN